MSNRRYTRRPRPTPERPTQAAILAALSDGPRHVKGIAAVIKKSVNAVQKIVWVLCSREKIERCARGVYGLPGARVAGPILRSHPVAQVHAVMADLANGKTARQTATTHGVARRWVELLVERPLKTLTGNDEERYLAQLQTVKRAHGQRWRPDMRRAM